MAAYEKFRLDAFDSGVLWHLIDQDAVADQFLALSRLPKHREERFWLAEKH